MSQAIPSPRFLVRQHLHGVMWGMLARVHLLRQRHPLLGRWLRRGLLLCWWIVTLQLHTHLRFWVRAHFVPAAEPVALDLPLLDKINPADVVLPEIARPSVSVIIPTYGQAAHTLCCLASIAASLPKAPIEVLVVDDAHPDGCGVEAVRGIRVLRNQENRGFLLSCNDAAKEARGAYLLFLNKKNEYQN